MALHKFMESIYSNINNKNIRNPSGLFLDIRKAFDIVEHGILLDKLEVAGIRGSALKWFTSYLTRRCQIVSVSGNASENQLIAFGVFQEYILGLILFLVFVNDCETVHSRIF